MKDKNGKEMSQTEIVEKIGTRFINIIMEFKIMLLHIVGFVPSHHIRRFFYRLSGIKIGKGSTFHMGAKFYDPENIVIGEDSILGEGVVLDGRGKLVIGNHVDIASEVMIYNWEHDINSPDFSPICESVIIEDYVFIGPRVIIQPGITIRKGAVVAAGAVVAKDVDEYTLVGGVPAKYIADRKAKDLNYRLGRAKWFR